MFEANKDILLTMDGDLALENGDIAITTGMDWYSREVNKRLRSGPDWRHHPNLGASLDSYIGFPNNRETGKRIETKVSRSLSEGVIHFPATLEIKVVPVSIHEIQLFVILSSLGEREVVIDQILHFDRGLSHPVGDPFFQRTKTVKAAEGYKTNENKYISRLT